MAQVTYSLTLTSDRTVAIKVGRMREYIRVEHKNRKQLHEAVRFALISKGVPVNKDRLNTELDGMIWNHVPKWQWY